MKINYIAGFFLPEIFGFHRKDKWDFGVDARIDLLGVEALAITVLIVS